MAKSRKNKVRKITASDRRAQIHLKRRNPQFRNHEKQSREEVELAVEYLTLTVNGEDQKPLLAKNQNILDRMDGLNGLHDFLDVLDGLTPDYQEKLTAEGLLTVRGVSAEGIDFALQNEEDKEKAISTR